VRLLTFLVFLQFVAFAQLPNSGNYWSVSGRFVGAQKCATCHPTQAKSFHQNSMSRALEPVETCAILKGDVHFQWQSAPYRYSISRNAGRVVYRVTDGKETFETPLLYAFGQGKAGQTYLYEADGKFYESRVSYYSQLNGLDLTVGAINSKPTDMRSAAGRIMDASEARGCFGCHTTGARVGQTLQLKDFEPGVQCESCHGPGGTHVDGMLAGKPQKNAIRSLKGMDAQDTNEFCGACHRTWEAVMMMGLKGINNARFPPYRLANSPCFSLTDRRISCTACHDPHQALATDDKAYDSKCTACHNGTNQALKKKTCPVAKQACTSCHMQRVEPAESHHAFPDHWIRVVRSKSHYPD